MLKVHHDGENSVSHDVTSINRNKGSNVPHQAIIAEIVDENVERLCKALCYGNRFEYLCTLDASWSRASRTSALCDLGNGTYEWMYSELVHIQNQNDLNNRHIELAENYYRKIAHSTSFWERLKNWRFHRRLRVPNYIKSLDPDARQVFLWMCNQDSIENMSQRLGRDKVAIKVLVNSIKRELHLRNRSYVLVPNSVISLDNLEESESEAILTDELAGDNQERKSKVYKAFQQLTWLEQYVVEAMIIENMQAAAVLTALQGQSISLSDKYTCQEMNTQHIYYFLRKTLARLRQISGIDND